MEQDEIEVNGNGGSTVPFFLIGLATGIAVTVLLVPRSGAATRRLLGRTFREGEAWVKTQAGAAQDYVRSHGTDLRERVKEATAVMARSSAQTKE